MHKETIKMDNIPLVFILGLTGGRFFVSSFPDVWNEELNFLPENEDELFPEETKKRDDMPIAQHCA